MTFMVSLVPGHDLVDCGHRGWYTATNMA